MSSGRIFLTENKLFSGVNVLARAGRESVSTAALAYFLSAEPTAAISPQQSLQY